MVHVSQITESQIRDELERRGIRTHTICSDNRSQLEALFIEHVVGADLANENTRSNACEKNMALNITHDADEDEDIDEDETELQRLQAEVEMKRRLQAEVERKRRILELRAELERLNIAAAAADAAPAAVAAAVAAPAAVAAAVAAPAAADAGPVAAAADAGPAAAAAVVPAAAVAGPAAAAVFVPAVAAAVAGPAAAALEIPAADAVPAAAVHIADAVPIAPQYPLTTPFNIDCAVDVFTGDDNYTVAAFVADFENAAHLFGWTDAFKAAYAKQFIRGSAQKMLRTVNARAWDDIQQQLKAEFAKPLSAAMVHKALAERRRKSNETPQQYTINMREIAARGNIEEVDLIGYIIDGLARDKSERMLLGSAKTMHELRDVINRFHDTFAVAAGGWPVAIRGEGQRSGQRNDERRTREGPPKCYNCNEMGHFASGCGKPKRAPRSCFKCGSTQHQQAQCTAKAKEVANIDIVLDEDSSFHEMVSLHLNNKVSKTTIRIKTLLDTGSPICFIQARYVPPVFVDSDPEATCIKFVGLNGSRMRVLGAMKISILFRARLTTDVTVLIVGNGTMRSAAIFGRDFLERNELQLVRVIKPLLNYDKPAADCTENDAIADIMSIDTNDDSPAFEINPKFQRSHLHFIQRLVQSEEIAERYQIDESHVEMNIRLSKDSYFHSAPRRLAYAEKEKVKIMLNTLLEQKVIRPSNSPFSSPIVLVKKKCGSTRMCVDYRELNKITLRDNYPLPLIEDQIDSLHGKKYYSCLDLQDGFYHVPVAAESVKYTSFVTPLGQFEFLRMPFGLKNAPSVFQRYINSIFRPLIDANKILIYMDDILIATTTMDEHLNILSEVFALIRKHCLKLKLKKCRFLFEEIDYLGYRVNAAGIQPNPSHLEAIEHFPVPKNSRDVHSFLGLASYFRKFMQNFATIAKPLYDLVRKDAVFTFGDVQLQAFNRLKQTLLSSPVLAIYSPKDPTELHCDASSLGYGAILLQRKSDHQWHPIFYFSKRTTDAESRYHSFELETLAIINALKRFRIYLEGIPFTIVTDCNSLAQTLHKRQINPRIARWALELENFEYEILHRGNERMRHVDALSRNREVLVVESNTLEQVLAVEQGRDETITKLRTQLEETQTSHDAFELQDGLVYKKADDGKLLFYVPTCMEDNVIRSCHDEMGHFGAEKVHKLLIKFYWFPHMHDKIKKYIRKCLLCIQFSPNSGKIEGELHNIPKGKLPFDTIHVDHLGPLETTKQKHKHVFLIVDGFTKFIKLYAVRSTSSKEAIVCLTNYFNTFSRPLRIISDRGTCFTSNEFAEFVADNNICHIKIASASPQSNGQAERMNRIITPMLAKISGDANWNHKLKEVEFCMNNTHCRSTGSSASILLFGIEQRGKVCDNIREFLASKIEAERDLHAFREAASMKIVQTQRQNKHNYDLRHRHPQKYELNDLVMVRNFDTTQGVNKKMLPKYRGPYEVKNVLPNDRYRLTDVENWQVTQRPYDGIHAPAQMRPWLPPESEARST